MKYYLKKLAVKSAEITSCAVVSTRCAGREIVYGEAPRRASRAPNMDTILTEDPKVAAEVIARGGLAAFPTETVFGLGANAFDHHAVEKIFAAKRRPQDNPLIVHIGDPSQIDEVARVIPPSARVLIDAFFPGPLSLVLPKRERISAVVSAGLDTVGVRMPDHTVALEFLRRCPAPIAAPSANISGRPSPTGWRAVADDLDGRIDCILKGEASLIGIESTVVDCSGPRPALLRPGFITLEQLQQILPEIIAASDAPERPRSPGMKHRHYSPAARVTIIFDDAAATANANAGYIGMSEPNRKYELALRANSVAHYAASLFEFFRECDRRGITEIFCEPVAESGLGKALMDRIRRAAED